MEKLRDRPFGNVKTFDMNQIKKQIKESPIELQLYIKAKESSIEGWVDICNQAKAKIKELSTPKHETVEQWEKRTGETYPDDGPLWWWVPMKGLEKWKLTTRLSVDLKYNIEKVYGKHKCIVANHNGKPNSIGER